ncbi:hypothetical protein L1987_28524 [Smallanthus sonchifolius]|uniref:Uncharacterized protein n=1 Tax=Smallanthus sonchifolius TaxID=185202 RepID=A0ACB9HYM6_9ASTR|nr:hypothetical protein L1987_28524 [Smallanthus sonchifolius]
MRRHCQKPPNNNRMAVKATWGEQKRRSGKTTMDRIVSGSARTTHPWGIEVHKDNRRFENQKVKNGIRSRDRELVGWSHGLRHD